MLGRSLMTNLQGVFNSFFDDFLETNHTLTYDQFQVVNSIIKCRTAELGGHANTCDGCGHTSIAYNSCRNRHCPMCQSIKREKWRIDRNADLLNIHYFHVVFTVPDALNPLFLHNKRVLYDLLMKSAAKTVTLLASNKKYLGADIGLTAILHTWGQTLSFHPHVHFIVPGGGLCPLTRKFKATRPNFLLPVKVLSRVFRAIFMKQVKRFFEARLLIDSTTRKPISNTVFYAMYNQAYAKAFVVFAKDTFDSPVYVVNYLCQYTHRIAISNHRIVKITDQHVTFKYKDYKDGGKSKIMTLKGTEFIRRFMMHVLPKRFVKIRHYGIFAGRNRPTKLAHCQRLMKIVPSKKSSAYSTLEFLKLFMNLDVNTCSKCESGQYKMVPLADFLKVDTS